jgi:HPt (histidine-containing phosphotransfer) domain-containing protein
MDDDRSKPLNAEELQNMVERRLVASAKTSAPSGVTLSTPDSPPVDLERLRQISGGNEQGLRDLIALYLRQTAKDLAQLQAAIQAGARRDVARLAHSCAGASANCGMVGIVSPLRALEGLARAGQMAEVTRLATAVEEAFDRIEGFLQAHRMTSQPLGNPPL